ncbi:MAG: type II toxin-antitoxin system RelE/ParE family toxin [Gammaproteobacteria bacterium]
MRLRWTRPALSDFIEAQQYIARENPTAAQEVAQRVWDAASQLLTHPELGRPGHVGDTREWVVTKTPYLIVYRRKGEFIEILRVWHAKRNWKDAPAS